MITVKDRKFWFNGKKKQMVWGRSSFKLANIVSYHYSGQGGDKPGHYSLSYAERWVDHNQRIFGEDVLLRVFLETAGWDGTIDGNLTNKIPEGGMFGSEPSDQGFWNVAQLRDGRREEKMHPRGQKVLEWFYRTSVETGVAFELDIIATLKHDRVPDGEIDHVIRQVGIEMGRLQLLYPKALIVVSACNEWNAHSDFSVGMVNMWATRWYRDVYFPNQTQGQIPLIVDGGGGDMFEYMVGTNAYHAGMIHPKRTPENREWWQLPDLAKLRNRAGSYPIGFPESMYYVEESDAERASGWYRNRSGWATDWRNFERFYESWDGNIDYGVIHDEKGAGNLTGWPRKETRMEAWAKGAFQGSSGGGTVPIPEPPPVEPPPIIIPPPVEPPVEPPVDPPSPPPTGEAWKALVRIEGKLDELLRRTSNVPPNPPTVPPVPPVAQPKPTDFIPLNDITEWSNKIRFAYDTYRGARDLGYLLSNLEYVQGKGYLSDLSAAELRDTIAMMDAADAAGEQLRYNLVRIKHPEFDDRSGITKNEVNMMVSALKVLTADYTEIERKIPAQPGCDSIRCRIKKMKGEG